MNWRSYVETLCKNYYQGTYPHGTMIKNAVLLEHHPDDMNHPWLIERANMYRTKGYWVKLNPARVRKAS